MKNIKKIARKIISYTTNEFKVLQAHNFMHDALDQAANDIGQPSMNNIVDKAQNDIRKIVEKVTKEIRSWED